MEVYQFSRLVVLNQPTYVEKNMQPSKMGSIFHK